jgi:nucleoside-triphosphatase THEP1
VIDLLAGVAMAGFYTEEIRRSAGRTGFRVARSTGGRHGSPA